MVHDVGITEYRERVESKLGKKLATGRVPESPALEFDHTGINDQVQNGLAYVVFPVFLGHCTGTQMIELADLADTFGGAFRLTRRQNIILSEIPSGRLKSVTEQVSQIGFPLEANDLRRSSIACTGEPFCNYAVGETKQMLKHIVEHLEAVFGDQTAGLRLNLDGCPHACAHHWIGDIGLQATTLRERSDSGERLRGYDLFLRGGLSGQAGIGKPVLRRVPADVVHIYTERLYRSYLDGREKNESIQQYFHRRSDEDLGSIAAGEAHII